MPECSVKQTERNGSGRNYRSLQMFKNEDSPSDALTKLGKKEVKEWPRKRIVLKEELGKGAFGEVQRGLLTREDKSTVDCAVKTLRVSRAVFYCSFFPLFFFCSLLVPSFWRAEKRFGRGPRRLVGRSFSRDAV
jgi:hypothetical protein